MIYGKRIRKESRSEVAKFANQGYFKSGRKPKNARYATSKK